MLVVGRNKRKLLEHLPDTFIVFDDGQLIDAAKKLPQLNKPTSDSPKIMYFDVSRDSFDPFRTLDYLSKCIFADAFDSAFKHGETTLTKGAFPDILLEVLEKNPKNLQELLDLIPQSKDPGYAYARQKIRRVLNSPILRDVLCRPTNISFDGIILARIDRSKIPAVDARVIVNLLIGQYKGTVVISDLGFYQCPFYSQLIQQNRLIAGINTFEEVPDLQQQLLLFKDKIGAGCTYEDAETLATYSGLRPDPTRASNPYNDFIMECMNG